MALNITREQALAEVARRVREERAEFYKPHPGQLAFHKCESPIRAVFAGNRWGKTYGLAMEIFWQVSKTHPYLKPLSPGPVKARVCSVDYQTSVKSMIEDTFKVLIPRRFLKGNDWETAFSKEKMTLYFKNGGFIEFMSYNQDVEAFAGVARHIIWEDEEPPEDIHRENMARLSTTKGILIMSMTPVRPQMWVVSEIYEKSDKDDRITVFKGIATENPHVDPQTIDMMLSQINDPVERAARLSGEFTWYAGKIYPTYGEVHHCEPFDPPLDWGFVVAVDPHDTKETAVTFGYWDLHGDVYFMDELWVGGDWQYIAGQIRVKCKGRRPKGWIIDPSSDRDPKIHGTESIFKKFQREFPDILKWVSHSGSVWMGVEDVRGMLKINPVTQKPRLFVCAKNCPMTDWQMSHWGLKPPTAGSQHSYKPIPMGVKDDFCDCVRGTVMHGSPIEVRSRRNVYQDDRFDVRSYQ